MALTLDPRQRAMLQEMGITLWLPKPVTPPTATVVPAAPVPDTAKAAVNQAAVRQAPATTALPNPAPVQAPAPAVVATRPPAPATPAAPDHSEVAMPAVSWQMAPAVCAYPQATGGHADDAWLVVWECPNPHAPLEGEAGKLLHNMLRALHLHHSPHVWIASMQRPGHEALPMAGLAPTETVAWQPLDTGLQASIEQAQPARMLVLGLQAARAVLGSQDALGRLRAQVHQVQQIPAVVSYDPAYLLRSPHAKPAAWSDLCRAHALRPPSAV